MNRMKAVLLSLIIVVQISTIVGGFFAYREMSQMLLKSQMAYIELVEATGGRHVDFGLIPNPFAPLLPLVLLGFICAVVLLVLELK